LHGDLSPNNFILYKGQVYFIDFDNAGITTESNKSLGNSGSQETVSHTAGDDLESLFYIFV
ncbi:hypothetical protein P692DRAFT_20701266, partial [Suillus brevipes Sb2]